MSPGETIGATSQVSEEKRDIYIYPTQLEMFQKCSHLYYLDKVLRMPTPKSGYLVAGTSVDAAINANLIAMRDHGKALDEQSIESVFNSSWEKEESQNETIVWEKFGIDRDKMKATAWRASLFHARKLAPTLKPKHVQQKFVLQVEEGVYLAGFPDVVEQDGFIRDVKFSQRRKRDDQLPRGQGIAYTILAQNGEPRIDVTGFQADYLIPVGESIEHDPRPIRITQREVDLYLEDVRAFARAIRSQSFTRCVSSSWWCSEKWCDHWFRCRGREE